MVESFTGLKNCQACPELWVMVVCSHYTEYSKEEKKKKRHHMLVLAGN